MTIDNAPAIKAYCQERIKSLNRERGKDTHHDQAILELERVIVLCDGLQKQFELLGKSMGL